MSGLFTLTPIKTVQEPMLGNEARANFERGLYRRLNTDPITTAKSKIRKSWGVSTLSVPFFLLSQMVVMRAIQHEARSKVLKVQVISIAF